MATEVPPTKADEGVDDSPIVVNSERRDSLDKKLQLRPDETDLKNRHILLDNTAAPALQARAAELERQRITDNLKKGLSHRPEKEILVQRNILLESSAAPGIQGQQRELQKHMRADSLEKHLQHRPDKDALLKEGILKDEQSVSEA
ncbi:uncharacterized protein SEPMUDRAFT_146755 [Sphaerulina musiva SO2202]|uniref:RPEL repeat protein n=1 Tax=Sphaerulina musiva (strain SO2202) TaxID=692275 RepID=N1QNY3_SPHMS|nr:uncharacterized protein SEPMUDRAFT_146755 [Sphaerulina musiva SO2202]EMF17819.1 hypothetical protein SEPMUDRAFT_146755 [Sphaerulina musiva SO2202]